MARKLKEIDIVEPDVVNKKRKIKKEPVEVEIVTSKEVEEQAKKIPTEKQIAAREKAKLAREEKKAKELEEIKQQAIEEALKAKEIADKKAMKAAERKAKKEKTEAVIQEPIVATPLEEFKDDPKPDKPTFTPKKEVISEPVVQNLKPPAIFSERPSDFNRGKKKGTPFGAGSIVRRIM